MWNMRWFVGRREESEGHRKLRLRRRKRQRRLVGHKRTWRTVTDAGVFVRRAKMLL